MKARGIDEVLSEVSKKLKETRETLKLEEHALWLDVLTFLAKQKAVEGEKR